MKIRNISSLIDGTLTVYKSNWEVLAGIGLLAGATQAALSFFTENKIANFPESLPLFFALLVLAIVVGLLSNVALILAVAQPSEHRSVLGAYEAAGKFFLPMLWTGILVMLAILGGFILLVIPGIIFAMWLMFSQYVLILENKRGVAALKASKAYVSGNWWGVFLRVLAFVFIFVLLSFAVGFLAGMVVPDKSMANAISAVVSGVLSPLGVVYFYLIYKDLSAGAPVAAPAVDVATPPQA